MDLDQLVFPKARLQRGHDKTPDIGRRGLFNFNQFPSFSHSLTPDILGNGQSLQTVFIEPVHIDRKIQYGHQDGTLPLDRAGSHWPFMFIRANEIRTPFFQIRKAIFELNYRQSLAPEKWNEMLRENRFIPAITVWPLNLQILPISWDEISERQIRRQSNRGHLRWALSGMDGIGMNGCNHLKGCISLRFRTKIVTEHWTVPETFVPVGQDRTEALRRGNASDIQQIHYALREEGKRKTGLR